MQCLILFYKMQFFYFVFYCILLIIVGLYATVEKCRRLYDTRLSEYIEKTDQQLTDYEEQLLQVRMHACFGEIGCSYLTNILFCKC